MKKISIICTILSLTFIFLSCDKETLFNNNENNVSQNKTEGIDLSQVPNYLDGKLILNLDSLDRIGDNLISIFDQNQNLILNFSTKSNFYSWANSQPHGKDIIDRDMAIDFLSDYADKSGAIAYYDQTGNILPSYQVVEDSIAALFVTKGKNLYTVLYDGLTQSGATYQLILTFHPTFGSFNNKTESARVYLCAISALCDKTWFRGARFYFVGFNGPVNDYGNWRNRFESCCLL